MLFRPSVSNKGLRGPDMATGRAQAHVLLMKTRTFTNVLLWLLVAFMFLLAVRGFASPVSAAAGFGFPLADAADGFYLHVKGDRDLAIGLAIAALILLRERRALIPVIAACLVAPLIDGALVVASGHKSVLYALAVHGSALAFGVALLALLVREKRGGGAPQSAGRADRLSVNPR